MDKIRVYDEASQEVEKEIILILEMEEKSYILYRDIEGDNKKIYASYFITDELNGETVNLYNDLSDDEFNMLENAYKEGSAVYATKE